MLDWVMRDVVVLPGAGLVAVWVVWRAGYLGRSAFRLAPKREVGLGVIDLLMGVLIMFVGMTVAQELLVRMGLFTDDGLAGAGGEASVPAQPASDLTPFEMMRHAYIGQACVQLPVVLYLWWRCSVWSGGLRQLGFQPRRPIRETLAGVLGLAVALPMTMGLSVAVVAIGRWFDAQTPEVGHELLGAVQESHVWWVTFGLIWSAVVVAPLLEEIIFRGLVQTSLLGVLGQSRRWPVVIFGAGWFALIHMGLPWQVLPSIFVLGLVLGWLYERTGSLLPGVLVHAGFNAVNMVLAMGVV